MFSVVARTLNIFGYDFGRAFLGLFILFVLAYWLLKCDRNWLLALIVFLWYAVPILTIHIRLGFAISLFCIFFSSLRDRNFRLTNAKLLILVATHYSMLLVKFINDFFHNRYVSSLTSFILISTLTMIVYQFAVNSFFEDLIDNLIAVYITSIEISRSDIVILLIILFFLAFLRSRLILLFIFIIFIKFFLGGELGGRVSSFLVLITTIFLSKRIA